MNDLRNIVDGQDCILNKRGHYIELSSLIGRERLARPRVADYIDAVHVKKADRLVRRRDRGYPGKHDVLGDGRRRIDGERDHDRPLRHARVSNHNREAREAVQPNVRDDGALVHVNAVAGNNVRTPFADW